VPGVKPLGDKVGYSRQRGIEANMTWSYVVASAEPKNAASFKGYDIPEGSEEDY
jgi:hypothetical protein